ncbi:MAG TPA: DNA starvation/stationary phase protection protein Dps [Haliangiales bacterium]|nr:DNA starvation/stationary phase protection protein Dps [Haliangiales bacterium]
MTQIPRTSQSIKRITSHVALPAPARQALVSLLNAHVATCMDLYTQVRQAKWNLAGLEFIALHQLFDAVAARVAAWTDQLAERAATLGGYVLGTARLAVAGSFLTEYDLDALSGQAHVRALVGQVATYTARLRDAIGNAVTVEDPATVDLLTRVLGEAEKDLWLLESHLG